jgi:hypothetical protein
MVAAVSRRPGRWAPAEIRMRTVVTEVRSHEDENDSVSTESDAHFRRGRREACILGEKVHGEFC